ncbi:mechanosensitive ion channel family protein [Cesiribacter andamanensis]|uniref:MscS family inner membrane protein YnaI n=1 Tax=Cesiribacter andamanensis AMV16 TaxID=1279009 RepID=M7N134_9BACT|nr:mechanosensitive ion channel family protein [Cesiribacter andamanensis]EMR02383.1 MscS family inner membrane protein YnaI [Cesiribacter andamanensis AMV16]
MNEVLERTFYQNTVQDYLIAFGIALLGLLLIASFRRTILSRIKRWTEGTKTSVDDFIVESFDRFGIPMLNVGALYMGIQYLQLPDRLARILGIGITIAITILVIRFVSNTLLLVLTAYLRRRHHGEEDISNFGGLKLIINLVLWFIGLAFLFDNLGYDLTAIIAGLGIGGIAIALAAQNILGDLFNYFVIFFDKPFEVGDFVVVDDKNGVIEHIGIKTTRIKTLSGEQLVFSNSDLTSSRIHNFKRMQQRRVVFKVGVTYDTPLEQLKELPQVFKSIILEQDPVRFDRAHFQAYADSSLTFEIVYYVLSSDYTTYMDIHQAINLRIYEEFQKREIEFAFPSRTLYLAGQPAVKAAVRMETTQNGEDRS